MVEKRLLDNVRRLGLPLMESDKGFDVNQALAEVVQSKDVRLWEGFPVLLALAGRPQGRSQRDTPPT